MEVEEEDHVCVVHKGKIDGGIVYVCHNCHKFYCVKCASVLKAKGEKCLFCSTEIALE